MADYSGTPLETKLGIKAGSRVSLLGAPPGVLGELAPTQARSNVDVIVFFTRRRAELDRRFAGLVRRLAPAGGLWVAWPKKAAKVETDLSFEVVQRIGLGAGLVDNKSCAVDDVWQALRFVYRLEDRPATSGRRRGSRPPA